MESKILKEIVEEYELEDGMNINLRCLHTIAKRKHIDLVDLFRILGICRLDEYLNIERLLTKNNYTICLYTESELYKVKEEIRIYLNNKDEITNIQFEEIQKKYKIEKNRLEKIMGIGKETSDKKRINLNLVLSKEIEKTKTEINEMCNKKDYATKKDIVEIQKKTKAHKKVIRQELSICNQSYLQLMNNKIQKTRIISYNTNKKIFLAKMDFKYYYKYEYLTSRRLKNKCQKLEIDFDDFLKGLHSNINHYKYNKMAIEKNVNGIFIGNNTTLSKQFIEENYVKIKKMINIAFFKATAFYQQIHHEKEEIESKVFFNIIKKCGIIEKNFKFDENLMFGMISKKAKYYVWTECNKIMRRRFIFNKYKEYLLQNFEEYNEDNYQRLMNVLDEQIYRKIIGKLIKYQEKISINRKSGLKKVAKEIGVSYDFLMQKIYEMQEMILKSGLVKRCGNGDVILTY